MKANETVERKLEKVEEVSIIRQPSVNEAVGLVKTHVEDEEKYYPTYLNVPIHEGFETQQEADKWLRSTACVHAMIQVALEYNQSRRNKK